MNPLGPDVTMRPSHGHGDAGSGARGPVGLVELAAGLSAEFLTRPASVVDDVRLEAVSDLDVDAVTGWLVWRSLQPDVLMPAAAVAAVRTLASVVGVEVDDSLLGELSAHVAGDAARTFPGGWPALPDSCCTQGNS